MKIPTVTIQQLLEAGVHLGHKTLRWNPKMRKYIFGKRDSIHIIDLTQTLELFNIALDYNWTDDVIVAADMDENLVQESYGKLNARISLAKNDKWQISLIGKNLTDEKTFMWGNDIPLGSLGFNGAYFKMIDPPRTVELTARINF